LFKNYKQHHSDYNKAKTIMDQAYGTRSAQLMSTSKPTFQVNSHSSVNISQADAMLRIKYDKPAASEFKSSSRNTNNS